MNIDELVDKFSKHQCYLNMGAGKISKQFDSTREDVKIAKKLVKSIKTNMNNNSNKDRRILVIGDTHFPFVRDGYLEFVKDIYDKYNCNEVIHIGDIVDHHYSSFHDQDPDGMSAGDELKAVYKNMDKLAKLFPVMKVCLGNHDNIPTRKAFNAGLSTKWIRSIKEVMIEAGIKVEGWEFAESFIIDDVLYTHGTGRKARQRGQKDLVSVVQGHYHSESYIEHLVGHKSHLWMCQVGCGIEDDAYAFAYGRNYNKSHINCAVVLENGDLPILEYMKL